MALPWSLFIVPALFYYNKLKEKRTDFLDFSVISFLVIFIIFSLIGSKRGLYLLQLYPFFAVIVAWFFKQHLTGEIAEKKSIVIPVVIMLLLFLTAGIYIYFNGQTLISEELNFNLNKDSKFFLVYQALYIFLIGTAVLFLFSLFAKKNYIFNSIVLFSVVLIILLKGLFLPTLNTVKSERYLAEDLAAAYEQNTKVGLWGSLNNDSGFVFYNGIYYDHIFSKKEEVNDFIKANGKQILIVNESQKLYTNFKAEEYQNFKVKEYRVGSSDMLLLIEKNSVEN
jgi:4-amino-4-deoxy-L-arabinose transferase-like glycosyltransferase